MAVGYSETMIWLFHMAVSISGYPTPVETRWPPVFPMAADQLSHEVCPEDPGNCNGLAAVYDTDGNRVLILNSLDIEDNTDNSFLLHEFVHFLQYERNGDAIFATCQATLNTEAEAYSAQNRYLKKMGQFARFGEALRFLDCGPGTVRPPVFRD